MFMRLICNYKNKKYNTLSKSKSNSLLVTSSLPLYPPSMAVLSTIPQRLHNPKISWMSSKIRKPEIRGPEPFEDSWNPGILSFTRQHLPPPSPHLSQVTDMWGKEKGKQNIPDHKNPKPLPQHTRPLAHKPQQHCYNHSSASANSPP